MDTSQGFESICRERPSLRPTSRVCKCGHQGTNCLSETFTDQSQTGNQPRRYENSWIRHMNILEVILLWLKISRRVQMKRQRCRVWEQATIIRRMLSFKWNGDRSDYHINRATLSYFLNTVISGIKLFATPVFSR